MLLALMVLTLSAMAKGEEGEWTTIWNGFEWLMEDDEIVQAHAPGFLYEEGVWYMVGEDRSHPWNPDVNLYSSRDLMNWVFLGKIIENGVTDHRLGRSRMIERAKLLHCPKTGKYVVWCHWESRNYAASEAACFVADSVAGPYKMVWCGRPLGVKSRDCNVFVDDDGAAYFVSTTEENQHLGLFRLSDDYLSVTDHVQLFSGQRREAPALVHVGERYFMLNSACSGWAPNQCKYASSRKLDEGWSALENVGDATAYRTQAAAILTIKGSKQTTYLYVGDRWMDPTLEESKIIIFPVTFEGETCQFHYREVFEINFETGEWREYKK